MKPFFLIGITTLALAGSTPVSGAIVFGPSGRSQIEDLFTNFGGTFEDFDSLQGQVLTNQVPGADFNTTLQRFPSVQNVNLDVGVIPFGFLQAPVGYITPFRLGNIPDGQSRWEIVFDEPQRWAGLVRNFNTSSFTEFWAGGALLASHTNTTNEEFVGFIAHSADPADWVTRIVADGETIRGVFQAGFGDDLFFGTEIPEPSSALLLGSIMGGSLLRRRRQR